ncbi:MAG: hypothetical protein VB120_07605 [Lachnospiraceae bacterium]|nr:hypothetical protein [Lachnospiraceae bacterium]
MSYIDVADKTTLDTVDTNVSGLDTKIGATTDSTGTVTTGTVMGKLNSIMNKPAFSSTIGLQKGDIGFDTSTTGNIFSLSGAGEIYLLRSATVANANSFKITLDGTDVYNGTLTDFTLVQKLISVAGYPVSHFFKFHFTNSFVINVSVAHTIASTLYYLVYFY